MAPASSLMTRAALAGRSMAPSAANKRMASGSDLSSRAKSALESGSQQIKSLQGKLASSDALGSAGKSLGSVGESAAGLLGGYRQPVMYNLAVGRELAKQIYIKEGLAPPSSLAEVRSVWQRIYESAQNPQFWKNALESGEWKRLAIYAVEAYGIFKIGEMLGRRHMVGYKLKGEKPASAHH